MMTSVRKNEKPLLPYSTFLGRSKETNRSPRSY
jgi:hypothetical protein